MQGNNAVSGTGKVAVGCSGVLGLTLGLAWIVPAHAALITTPFSSADTTNYRNGNAVTFGPSWDSSGFTAQRSTTLFDFLNLTGNGGNSVAVTTPGCTMFCTLQTFAPGDSVDSTDNFTASGSFKVNGVSTAPDGDYFFGLRDAHLPPTNADSYGWLEISIENGDVTLDQFAFQDIANAAAVIPSAAAVPEPLTMSLFAVGGAAVLAARRRKRADKAA